MDKSLGEKIREFRKRAEISQTDLEIELSTSSGTISRIEQGQVNPTKETLLRIAEVLKLTKNETADLFEIRPLYPSSTEIAEAITEVKSRFEKEGVFAYLIDDWINVYAVSRTCINFFGLTPEHLTSGLGRCLYELLFDENLPLRKKMDPEYIQTAFVVEIARMRHEIENFEKTPLFSRLRKIPEFEEIYEKGKEVKVEDIVSPESKLAYFISEGKRIRMNFSRDRLKINPRFEVIEYFNPVIIE